MWPIIIFNHTFEKSLLEGNAYIIIGRNRGF
nr:MAG TPA: hypothetical protein [Caudoviricetes sp.]